MVEWIWYLICFDACRRGFTRTVTSMSTGGAVGWTTSICCEVAVMNALSCGGEFCPDRFCFDVFGAHFLVAIRSFWDDWPLFITCIVKAVVFIRVVSWNAWVIIIKVWIWSRPPSTSVNSEALNPTPRAPWATFLNKGSLSDTSSDGAA